MQKRRSVFVFQERISVLDGFVGLKAGPTKSIHSSDDLFSILVGRLIRVGC
ncbi:hypothetical protein O1D97_15460 [Marinomonas sp. 15G1-11]|uniref:Uncharacterized protein n=1 Tax=Marinomonas phaeophyticola TaxID=3004091 RepID=A0ABT4JXL8_9GAMM|nr:hypothetical protein [Marinomonas sp. 15G1-11]MCZ2722971.1 hypothetical protein [Marinomonas sp. 15G1-11]